MRLKVTSEHFKILRRLLVATIKDKGIKVKISDDAIDWFVANGYDKAMGARPMLRLVQNKIKKPLAEDILFGKLINGGDVNVSVADNDISLEIDSADARKSDKDTPKEEADA